MVGVVGQGDSVEIRFQRNCSEPTQKECIEWLGARDKNGYGRIKPQTKKRMRAHRFSYQCFIGEIPEGYLVCHKCDNPSCVNPEHLFLGTPKDNTRDMHKKGRAKCNLVGLPMKMLPNSKLNKEQVLEIRKLIKEGKILQKEIAKMFNVHCSTILNIKKCRTWYHI